MSLQVLDPVTTRTPLAPGHPPRTHPEEMLILSELDPNAVMDNLEDQDGLNDGQTIELITFGTMRETCPCCQRAQLKLVLRQRRVRLAHLLCSECLSCYDAHYSNGASALTI